MAFAMNVVVHETYRPRLYRRSAFTYCEDEWPSRLDLGKENYGGQFTLEQVEDVKTFLGILKVLFSIVPLFTLQVVSESMLLRFAMHSNLFLSLLEGI